MTRPLLVVALALLVPGRTSALPMAPRPPEPPATAAPPRALEGVGITERLGEQVPAGLVYTDSSGRPVRLAEVLARGKPVVLTLVYYECPMLCGLLLGGLTSGLKSSGLELGRDYEAVTLSFDPRETSAQAADKKGRFLQALGRPDGGGSWAFLVGEQERIGPLAEALGFGYRYDGSSKEYAHVAAAFVLTPDGRISRYLYGVRFEPRDLKLAVLEAGEGRVGSAFERALLTCYRWNPASRRYAFFVSTYLRAGGLLVFLGLAGLIATMLRRERRKASAR